MTWQAISDVTQAIINENAPGCPDCGTVKEVRTANGYTARYPGVECCPPAIRRQIDWRAQEIDQVQADIQRERNALNELRQAADEAPRTSKDAAEKRHQHADKGHQKRMEDKYEPQLKELSSEIARLKRKLNTMTNATT